ncbi:carbohydrate ABC transporter permease [Pseudonocardia sp. GCM10023141]|uniref:carbohydrate ABC transporter permease n=1 Tax=Pseudonocardia sp. GCM10023141 TaxID=3252653 RepID=UPI00361B87D5
MTIRSVGKGVGVAAVLAFTLLPVWMMVSTSLNGRANAGSRTLWPDSWTFDNFTYVFREGGFGTYLLNSLIVAIATVIISAALAMLAAVAVARFRFRFRTSVLVMVLIIQMVPLEALVIPLFVQARNLGMLNSLMGLVIVYLAFSLPFAIWTLRGFVAAVPVELEEAAFLDGASWWRMFWSVLFPLVAPGLVATSVFSFITAWNEFIFALTFMSQDDNYTVAVGLRQFFGQHGTDWGSVMAASTIITIPVMIFFIIAQKRLTDGLVAGAVKG